MALPLYLARTRAEMAGNPDPLPGFAYMACHFSPGGKGLSNCPDFLPPGAILLLDDSTPMADHDPEQILSELSALVEYHRCEGVLLDFQRPGIAAQEGLARILEEALPCPVGVSELYARELTCPVFLSPVPPDKPPASHLANWAGREIWLEAALDALELTLSDQGCAAAPLLDFPPDGHRDTALHCHYQIDARPDAACFRLWRTREDLESLLAEAETLGVRKAIGLWQELGEK